MTEKRLQVNQELEINERSDKPGLLMANIPLSFKDEEYHQYVLWSL